MGLALKAYVYLHKMTHCMCCSLRNNWSICFTSESALRCTVSKWTILIFVVVGVDGLLCNMSDKIHWGVSILCTVRYNLRNIKRGPVDDAR